MHPTGLMLSGKKPKYGAARNHHNCGLVGRKKFCGTEDKILKYMEFISLKVKNLFHFVVFNKH